MKRILFTNLLLLSLLGSVRAQEITGKWHGKANLGFQSLRINFDIRRENGQWTGAMQSPDQSGEWIPFTSITYENDTLRVAIRDIMFSYTGKLTENGLEGSFSQFTNTFPLDLTRNEILLNRPQEPSGEFPYSIEEVSFPNEKGGFTLAGTLTFPSDKAGPYPAVILVSGSGPQDRDETLAGHKPFWVIADHLSRQGIAVLRYDDRGFAGSEGEYAAASIEDFAEDARSALRYLQERPEIAFGKTGVVGHSEGGMIALMLGASDDVDYIVTLAAPGVNGKELLNQQRSALFKTSGAPDEFIDQYNEVMNRAVDIILEISDPEQRREKVTAVFAETPLASSTETTLKQLSSPEMLSFIRFNPADYYPAIRCPVLALNGEKDLQVPAGPNLEGIKQGLSLRADARSYPGLNHLFQTAQTGMPTEYGTIEETFSPEVLADISKWILEITGE